MRHFNRGCAVTSHSSQELTAECVLVNIDSNVHHSECRARQGGLGNGGANHSLAPFLVFHGNACSLLAHDTMREGKDIGARVVATDIERHALAVDHG